MQEKLGWAEKLIPCYDIRQQCSGFIYGIQMAQSFVESGMFSNVLLVGAEIHSNALDFNENEEMYPKMPSSRNLFANAVRRMAEVSASVLKKAKISIDQVDWVLPHQANMRINLATAGHLGIDEKKVLFNIQRYGNTTAATIPLLLAEFTDNGTIKRGDILLMPCFGSGFVWGASLVSY